MKEHRKTSILYSTIHLNHWLLGWLDFGLDYAFDNICNCNYYGKVFDLVFLDLGFEVEKNCFYLAVEVFVAFVAFAEGSVDFGLIGHRWKSERKYLGFLTPAESIFFNSVTFQRINFFADSRFLASKVTYDFCNLINEY